MNNISQLVLRHTALSSKKVKTVQVSRGAYSCRTYIIMTRIIVAVCTVAVAAVTYVIDILYIIILYFVQGNGV